MAKKLSLLLAAVAVLAFAVPVMASAAVPTLVNEASAPYATGTEIRGTGSEVNLTSSTLGAIKCKTLTLNGTLTVNDMTNGITGKNTGETPVKPEDCTNGGNAVTITNVTLEDLASSVGGSVTASFTVAVDIGTKVCSFKGSSVAGTYANGGNVLTFTEATGVAGGACGTAKLDGSFVLETATGGKVKAIF